MKGLVRILAMVGSFAAIGTTAWPQEEAAVPSSEAAVSEMILLLMKPAGLGGDSKVEAKGFYDSIWTAVNTASASLSETVDAKTGAVGSNLAWAGGSGTPDVRAQTVGLSLVMAGIKAEDKVLTLLGCRALHFAFKRMQNDDGSFIGSKLGSRSLRGTSEMVMAASQAIQALERSFVRSDPDLKKALPFWRDRTVKAVTWLCAIGRSEESTKKVIHGHWAAITIASLVRFLGIAQGDQSPAVEVGMTAWIDVLRKLQASSGAFVEGKYADGKPGFDTVYQAYCITFLSDAFAHNALAQFDSALLDMLGKAAAWQMEHMDKSGKPSLAQNTTKNDEKTLELMDLAMLIVSLKMWAIVGKDSAADQRAMDLLFYALANIGQFDSSWASGFQDGAVQGIGSKIPGR